MDESTRKTSRPWVDRASAGFVLVAIVLVTVAVVAPELEAIAGSDARSAALADANAIGVALRAAFADAGEAVAAAEGVAPRWLVGPGVLPRGAAWTSEDGTPLSAVLVTNGAGAAGWRGPYLVRVPIDPWARAYVALLDGVSAHAAIVIVSAGPDGVVQSSGTDRAVLGDDVGIVLAP